MPWILILIAVTFMLSWKIAGWRGGLLSLASFIGLWLLGKWLGPAIGQPRPSSEAGSGHRLTLRLCIPLDLRLQLYIDSGIPGSPGGGQNIGKASNGYTGHLFFAACCGVDCQGRTGCSLAQRRGHIIPHRASMGYFAHSVHLNEIVKIYQCPRD